MLNFCTLFDSNYLAKGLVLYQSLKNVCTDFQLYIFAFDDKAYSMLTQLKLENVIVISLSDFEDSELLSVKPTRTKAEYCWTSASSTILYCLNNFKLDHCTYIDADLFFISNPKALVDEMGNDDVLITDHRYTAEYDQSALSGRYCVQFVTFKNNENGLTVLNWWRNACIDWCYNRREDGKFGDQKYLDDWTERFKGIHDLQHLGGGVAPWNVQQYKIEKKDTCIIGNDKVTDTSFSIVFYHFHHLNNKKINFINEFQLGPYLLSNEVIRFIYKPYIEKLKKMDKLLKSKDANFDSLGSNVISLSVFRLIAHIIKNSFKQNKIIWLR